MTSRPDPWNDPHGYEMAKRRALEHPEAIIKRSNVVIVEEDFYEQTYIVVTVRLPGESGGVHMSFMEWVDRRGDGHQEMLPGKVVQTIARHIKTTNTERRSEVGRRQHEQPAETGAGPGFDSLETGTE